MARIEHGTFKRHISRVAGRLGDSRKTPFLLQFWTVTGSSRILLRFPLSSTFQVVTSPNKLLQFVRSHQVYWSYIRHLAPFSEDIHLTPRISSRSRTLLHQRSMDRIAMESWLINGSGEAVPFHPGRISKLWGQSFRQEKTHRERFCSTNETSFWPISSSFR